MRRREVLHRSTTPDHQTLELALEGGFHVIRVDGVPLMTGATFGSEQSMSRIAAEVLRPRRAPKVLVGGLGMGFTLRAALDVFGADASIVVAELLPCMIEFSRGVLGHLADQPLRDPRVRLHEGDVREVFGENAWDVILLDVDNGPEAFTVASNASLYSAASLRRLYRSLRPGGVFITWSAYASPAFEARLRAAGFHCEVRRVRARGEIRKGAIHTLFVAQALPIGPSARRLKPRRDAPARRSKHR